MFKWLKEKATAAAAKQCRFNIRLNTKTLVTVANRADQHLRATGGALNESDRRQVHKAQEAVLKDIILGYSNGLSLQEIKKTVIDRALDEEQVSDGARLAVDHALDSAAESLGVSIPAGLSTEEAKKAVDTLISQGVSAMTSFLEGKVRIESFDYETTQFRLIKNNALVSVLNDTHLRLVEDIRKIPTMPYFEIIAPMTAVEVLEGDIPETYLHKYSLAHYLTLRKHYTGE